MMKTSLEKEKLRKVHSTTQRRITDIDFDMPADT